MMYEKEFDKWMNEPTLDESLKQEMLSMTEAQKKEAFYTTLEFGTGGMRGILGAGINRMNIYTIRKVSMGFGQYIASLGDDAKKRGIVISYDCRNFSKEFSVEAARVFASLGIKTYVFSELRPTPELSFAVRHYNAAGGVMITASHNPPNYNGYKVYDETGCQLLPDEATVVVNNVKAIENELSITVESQEVYEAQGLIEWVLDGVDLAYNHALLELPLTDVPKDINVVFTPLHGTALKPVMRVLETQGYTNISLVSEQAVVDGNFSTVKSPNPESPEAFTYAIKKGKEVGAEILLATDPDADRVGLAVLNNDGEYTLLTGNQQGALLVEYVLSRRQELGTLPENGVLFDTIVSSRFAATIAQSYGVDVESVLTGFKFIGERINKYEQSQEKTFLFGYEESYGSLMHNLARDKDAVQAVMMSIEMASYYKAKGKTLLDVLEDLYQVHGYFGEKLVNIELAGLDGAEKIVRLMETVRTNPFTEVNGERVVCFEDYK
ncbi:MAG: phospho-sugar mutase, partial [Culicoidibacterales bacterium]